MSILGTFDEQLETCLHLVLAPWFAASFVLLAYREGRFPRVLMITVLWYSGAMGGSNYAEED
jgi:hypothetical protein